VFGTLLFWYLGFSVFWYSGSSTPYVRFIGSINFIPILLRRERHARHDPLVVTPNPRLSVKNEACSKADVVLASLSLCSSLSQARGGGGGGCVREGAWVGGEEAEGSDGWGGGGGCGGDVGGQDSGGRCVGIMVNDSMLELFGDARLESCSNLHRVLLTLNLKP